MAEVAGSTQQLESYAHACACVAGVPLASDGLTMGKGSIEPSALEGAYPAEHPRLPQKFDGARSSR